MRENLLTGIALCEMVSPDRNMLIAIMLYRMASAGALTPEKITEIWDEDVSRLVNGLMKVSTLYGKQTVVKSDNFRRLLMALADDILSLIHI